MYKALITDLDGTAIKLSSDSRSVTKESQKAVLTAQKMGFKVACATGRRWKDTQSVVEKLGIKSPCIIEGGTRIVNPINGETIWEKHLSHKALNETLAVFKKEADDGLVSTFMYSKRPLREVNELTNGERYAYILGVSGQVAENICNAINVPSIAVAHMTPSWFGEGQFDVHVTHPEATKEHAIKVWQSLEGVKISETIGMGDGGNDLPIFEAVGLKVAVENATNELKALADFIAPDQKDDALAFVINKFLINQ